MQLRLRGNVWLQMTLMFTSCCYITIILNLKNPMKLQSTQTGRAFIDVTATVLNLRDVVILQLLPAHALSGCDTVPMCHGIGKNKMLKVVVAGKYSLSLLGDVNANMEDIIKQATAFGRCND